LSVSIPAEVASMAIRLFCRTTQQSAARIWTGGVRDTPQGSLWLSRDPLPADTHGTSCLAVVLDLPEDVLERFAIDLAAEETWDDEVWNAELGQWVKRPAGEVERLRWYEVPAAVLRKSGRVKGCRAPEAARHACIPELR
jgi:hypothetical protein